MVLVGWQFNLFPKWICYNSSGGEPHLRSNEYKPDLAQRKYEQRIDSKPKRVNFTESIHLYVESKLRQDYSPEQIVGVSQLENIKCVSVERIYQYVWADKKNGGKLYIHLRNKVGSISTLI